LEEPCLLAADSAQRLDTVTIALSSPLDLSHAPVPTNQDERLVFRQLFPGLIRLDCKGELRPALATSWQSDTTAGTWTFVLRDGARFPDGSSLTARSIEADWIRRDSALREAGLDSVRAIDDRTLQVAMQDLRDSLPRVFADPLWSVVSDSMATRLSEGRLTVSVGPGRAVLAIAVAGTRDLRDALDAGADLVVSGDPQVIDYAARTSELNTYPLPWDRTYALLQHPGAQAVSTTLDSTLKLSLVRDVVQTDARPSASRHWWNSSPCSVEISMVGTTPTGSRIVYQQTDPVARQLAERLVAVADVRSPLSALASDPLRFAAELERGADRGYIVAIPLQSASPCRESAQWTRRGRLYPLIETRQHAIVRQGSPALSVDWDGTPRFLSETDLQQETSR
jgi:extracellular solute-binding protein (family 5)